MLQKNIFSLICYKYCDIISSIVRKYTFNINIFSIFKYFMCIQNKDSVIVCNLKLNFIHTETVCISEFNQRNKNWGTSFFETGLQKLTKLIDALINLSSYLYNQKNFWSDSFWFSFPSSILEFIMLMLHVIIGIFLQSTCIL